MIKRNLRNAFRRHVFIDLKIEINGPDIWKKKAFEMYFDGPFLLNFFKYFKIEIKGPFFNKNRPSKCILTTSFIEFKIELNGKYF